MLIKPFSYPRLSGTTCPCRQPETALLAPDLRALLMRCDPLRCEGLVSDYPWQRLIGDWWTSGPTAAGEAQPLGHGVAEEDPQQGVLLSLRLQLGRKPVTGCGGVGRC